MLLVGIELVVIAGSDMSVTYPTIIGIKTLTPLVLRLFGNKAWRARCVQYSATG
jgi:hypothetical protein